MYFYETCFIECRLNIWAPIVIQRYENMSRFNNGYESEIINVKSSFSLILINFTYASFQFLKQKLLLIYLVQFIKASDSKPESNFNLLFFHFKTNKTKF